MANYNKAIIAGRLGKDPEVRQVGDTKVVSFSVATSERFTKNGEQQEHTDWHNIEAWGKTGEFVEKYFKKGSLILVEGKIRYESYTDKDGHNKISTKIRCTSVDFVGSKQSDNNDSSKSQTNQSNHHHPDAPAANQQNDDDDLPF